MPDSDRHSETGDNAEIHRHPFHHKGQRVAYGNDMQFNLPNRLSRDMRNPHTGTPASATNSALKDDDDEFIPFAFDEERRTLRKGKRESSPLSATPQRRKSGTPWTKGKNYRRLESIAKMLHCEILDYCAYMSPIREEYEMRNLVVERVRKVLANRWRGVTVEVFGSCNTKLCLPTSDIDIIVFLPPGDFDLDKYGPGAPDSVLYEVRDLLESNGAAHGNAEVVSGARIPIVKFTDADTKLKVDLSFNSTAGLVTADTVREFLVEYRALMPLTLVLKHFLRQQDMGEVYFGGLGSFSILCLVLSLLQMHPKIRSGDIRAEDNLGVVLLEFFELYGKFFDYENNGISVRDGGYYFEKNADGDNWTGEPFLLSILDPNDPANDIAKSSFRIREIKNAFADAADKLSAALLHAARSSSRIHTSTSILGSVIQVSEEEANFRKRITRLFHRGDFQRKVENIAAQGWN